MIVRWSEAAIKDMDEITEWLAERDPAAAERVRDTIEERAEELADFPELGPPGRVPGTRQLVETRYRYALPYRLTGNTAEIIRVLRGQDWPAAELFGDADMRTTLYCRTGDAM